MKRSLLLQALQMGQPAFGHEALGETRVEAVESEEDDALDLGLAKAVAAADERACGADRPQQKGAGGEEEADDQAEESAEERETGAGSDVGEGRKGHLISIVAGSPLPQITLSA